MKMIFSGMNRENMIGSTDKRIGGKLHSWLPGIAIWIIILVVSGYLVHEKLWKKPEQVIKSDVMAYYLYLPAVFVHNDISLSFINRNPERFTNKVWFIKSPTGQKVIQFTYGMSFMYFPFFIVAHWVAPLFGYQADGYSAPYKLALLINCLFYLGWGLFFLKRVLLKYFSKLTTSVTLVAVALGTNLLYYAAYEAPMSHAYNFALIAGFIYLLINWLEKPVLWKSVCLGLVTGMIVLIRPTNVLVVILFLLWGIFSWRSLTDRILFLLRSYRHILIMIFFAFLVWVPQFIYWKEISGSFLFFSYGERAHFFWAEPQIINILFSYRKGWFLYTPLMLIAVAGIPFLFRKHKGLVLPVALFTAINIYILSSWCFWWYGGSFGLRAFVDMYAFMAIPLAAITGWSFQKNLFTKIFLPVVLAVLISHNIFQIIQYRTGAIHFVSMTKEAYWETFLKKRPTKEFYEKLEFPDYKAVEEKIRLAKERKHQKINKD
jgi:hypothetical protein